MIGCPVDILPFQNRQLFYHTCRHLLSLNQRPHPNAFQYVKEKMGIDLAVQGKKLGILSGKLYLLFLQPVFIYMEDQIIHLLYHAVIIPHQSANLILPPRVLYPLQRSLLYLVKRGAQLPKPVGKGFIYRRNHDHRQKKIYHYQENNQRNMLFQILKHRTLRLHNQHIHFLPVHLKRAFKSNLLFSRKRVKILLTAGMLPVGKQNPVSLTHINLISKTNLCQFSEDAVIIQIHSEDFFTTVLFKIIEAPD